MPSIIIKDVSGMDFPAEKISLKGGGIINTVSNNEFGILREKYNFDKFIEKGLIVVGSDENSSDDVKQKTLDKQKKDIENNQSANNVELTKK